MPVIIHDLVVSETPAPPPPTPASQAGDSSERALEALQRNLELAPHRAARARAH